MQRLLVLFFSLTLFCTLSGNASAEIIDDISLKTDANGEVDATVKFIVPIHYLRHFPQQKSPFAAIYFTILDSVPPDQWQNYESHRSPPSDAILGFLVTTRDLNTGPRIEIQFVRPVEYKVYIGKDGRSLLIHIKPDKQQQKSEGKPAAALPIGAVPTPAPIAAIATTAVATGGITTSVPASTSAPTTAIPTQPVTTPAQPPATSPPPQSMPSTTPAPVVAKTGVAQIGGKDGLPAFPVIEQVPQGAVTTQPADKLSLPELIKKTNNQAAVWMAKGRDAVSAGEMFVAIEAFNEVLKLPPNNYSQSAQVWIGIAREKTGQPAKAIIEYQTYLKLYPDGYLATWVNDRLAKLKAVQPALFATAAVPAPVPVRPQSTEFQTTEYGSLSMYYYHGASHTDTIATVGNVATPTSLTRTDQSSIISNVSMTARSYNNQFDNRLVFQDFYAANFLPGQTNKNRLNAAYLDVKNRIDDYSIRIGRQSAMGGGVLGRFDGIAAGYGFIPNWRANVVSGKLSDATNGPRPIFFGASLDVGVNSPLGGSLYAVNQTVSGIVDRRAVGGNMRYFSQQGMLMTMLDYDVQFKELNMVTVQGTLNADSGTNYNFLLDRRKTPSLSVRSAVNGTAASLDTLLQNGWTKDDLILLAKQRTAISNMAQFGVTNRLDENWQMGTDIVVSNTTGMRESGTQFTDPATGIVTTGLDGFVPGAPASGNTWTLSERLTGNNIISRNGISMCSLSYTKSHLMTGKSLLFNNREYIQEQWTLDGTLRLFWQTDNFGGKQNTISPVFKLGYRLKTSLTVETEFGLDRTKATPSSLQSSKSTRNYFSFGFRWDY